MCPIGCRLGSTTIHARQADRVAGLADGMVAKLRAVDRTRQVSLVNANRALDITVFGATAFVGKLVVAYLTEHAPNGVHIGLAGHSQGKLARVRAELPDRAREWPLVMANSGDAESLAAMARGTRVVATTVGPYRRGPQARRGLRRCRHRLRRPHRRSAVRAREYRAQRASGGHGTRRGGLRA